jgi:4a-hydroxytetrahydrobiopterin dehydratase
MAETLRTMAEKACPACAGNVPPLKGEDLLVLHEPLGADWQLVEEHHLVRGYTFPNFVQALAFTNVVGGIAEDVNHHPDILTTWGKVEVTIWTHKIDGLTESDFVFAAKVEKAFQDAL